MFEIFFEQKIVINSNLQRCLGPFGRLPKLEADSLLLSIVAANTFCIIAYGHYKMDLLLPLGSLHYYNKFTKTFRPTVELGNKELFGHPKIVP